MIKIVADTTAGLPLETYKERGIVLLPQIVIFGETSYRDDTELDTATFLQKLRAAKALPKTAAPPPPLYHPIFESAAKNGDTLLVIVPSGKVSGTLRSVETAKQEFPNADIRIIDTQTIAGSLGSLVLLADDLVKAGLNAESIIEKLEAMLPRERTYFVIDTLEYLQKGGRIGAARALIGELLQVKPILQIKNGQVAPFDQERTKKRATARLIEIVTEEIKGKSDAHLCVMHADAEEEAKALCLELSAQTGIQNIPIYLLPPAIVVHTGPKTLAVGFFTPVV